MRNMYWIPFCVLLAGCHTIQPSALPSESLLSGLPRIDKNVTLVLDQNYANYISKDRGNPLADPQKYYVGAPLASLTKAYFEKTFSSTLVVAELPSNKISSDYLVYPRVEKFENSITLSEQTITLLLKADIYKTDLSLLDSVTVWGSGRGDLPIFGTSERSGETVNLAIQNTLSNLLREIHAKLTKTQ